jgi:hypothetical protein
MASQIVDQRVARPGVKRAAIAADPGGGDAADIQHREGFSNAAGARWNTGASSALLRPPRHRPASR